MPAKPTASPAPRRAQRLLPGAVLLLALLGAGHALAWHALAGRLEAGAAAWADQRRVEGWRVEHAAPVRGGWPWAATLTLPGFRLAGDVLDWRAEALVLRLAPPRLDRLEVAAPGRQALRLGALELGLAADRLRAVLPIPSGAPPREAQVEADRLRLDTPAGPAEARAARLTLENPEGGGLGVALRGVAEGVELPAGLAGPALAVLGRSIAALGLDAALSGPAAPGRGPAARAAAWRDAGGTLELRRLDLRWGPAAAEAAATMALDDALQPAGAGTLRLTGGAEVLEAAAGAGLLPPRNAAVARGMLRLLSRVPPEGGPSRLEVPVTLEDRTLALASLPLLRLPAWAWPP